MMVGPLGEKPVPELTVESRLRADPTSPLTDPSADDGGGEDDPGSPPWRHGPLFNELLEEAWKANQGETQRHLAPRCYAQNGRIHFNSGTGTENVDLTPDEATALGVAFIEAAQKARQNVSAGPVEDGSAVIQDAEYALTPQPSSLGYFVVTDRSDGRTVGQVYREDAGVPPPDSASAIGDAEPDQD
jgi:hypothetical protein